MNNIKWNIGICSWSLQTEVGDVAETLKNLGLKHVHLAVGPALGDDGDEYLDFIKKQDWVVSSTMIDFEEEDYSTLDSIKVTGGVLPDETWEKNKDRFDQAARITKELRVKYLSTHVGFIDHTQSEKYEVMKKRIRCLADISAGHGIGLLMETGQESAKDLAHFVKEIDRSGVGINFDPANMILYDKGNPIDALKILSPWIRHVHIKDCNKTETPGQWGTEVPWGDGQVDTDKFLAALKEIGYEGTLAVEREDGEDREGDIALAVERLNKYIN